MIYLALYVVYMLQGKALMNKCQDAGTQLDLSTVTNLLPIIGSAPKERFDAIDTNSADCASILSKIAESTSITAEKVHSNINQTDCRIIAYRVVASSSIKCVINYSDFFLFLPGILL